LGGVGAIGGELLFGYGFLGAIRRTDDIVFALNQITLLAKRPGWVLHNRLDLSRILVFGHSAGGQAAVRTCQVDVRVRACLNQDGEMFGIPVGSAEPIPTVLPGKPTLRPVADIYVAEPVASDAQLAAVKVTRKQFEDWRAAKNRALRGFLQQNSRESYLITITAPGYVHNSFMDIRLLTAKPDPEVALNHRTGTDITRAFFDAHLRWGEQKNWSRFAMTPRGNRGGGKWRRAAECRDGGVLLLVPFVGFFQIHVSVIAGVSTGGQHGEGEAQPAESLRVPRTVAGDGRRRRPHRAVGGREAQA
jgi:hypothetical protein